MRLNSVRQTVNTLRSHAVVKFLTVGSATFVCEYVVFYVLYVFLGWNLLLANSLSFGVGLSMSFMLNRIWAFKQTTYKRRVHHQMMIYIALALSNLVINNLMVSALQSIGIDPRIGKVVAIATIAVWNFLIYKFIIFSAHPSAKNAVAEKH